MPEDKINLNTISDEDVQDYEEIEQEIDEGDGQDSGIFPDGSGPTEDLVDLWRSKYGQVYYTEVEEGEYYIWRILTRPELKNLAALTDEDSLYKEELICEKCVLWPTEYTPMSGKAGIPTVLAEQIFEKSGFVTRTGPVAL